MQPEAPSTQTYTAAAGHSSLQLHFLEKKKYQAYGVQTILACTLQKHSKRKRKAKHSIIKEKMRRHSFHTIAFLSRLRTITTK